MSVIFNLILKTMHIKIFGKNRDKHPLAKKLRSLTIAITIFLRKQNKENKFLLISYWSISNFSKTTSVKLNERSNKVAFKRINS